MYKHIYISYCTCIIFLGILHILYIYEKRKILSKIPKNVGTHI